MSWFTQQEWQRNGGEGMVYVWVLRKENIKYNRFVPRKRFCPNYHRERYGVTLPKPKKILHS